MSSAAGEESAERGPKATWGLAAGEAITPELSAVQPLGGGATYEVWLAFDQVTLGPVVVKLLRPPVTGPEGVRRLRREVEALERVRHPAVVRALRYDLDGPRPHVVLEHLDGPRLVELVRRDGPLPAQQYLPMAIELAAAVHYLGGVGLVHLDLKPGNVVMGAPARLIDLSVARTVERAASLDRPVGTGAWMSPEATLVTGGPPGPAADVWGIGVTLHHAISGVRPFRSGDRSAIGAERWPQLVEPAASLPSGTPREVAEVVAACLSLHPGDRPRPAEIAARLEPVLDRLPTARLRP